MIWLSILELAVARDEEIVFLTSNTKDFGDGADPVRLAKELADDLAQQGSPRDQVRLVPGIAAFEEEVGERLESARELATELADRGAFSDQLQDTLTYSRLDQHVLELGVELDEDPQVVGFDLESLTVEAAAELPGQQLLIEAKAEASVLLDLMIYRADYYLAEGDEGTSFKVGRFDPDALYVEAEQDVVVELALVITTDRGGADADFEVTGVALAPVEVVHRALRGRGREELFEAVRETLPGEPVEDYRPPERIESNLEEVTVEAVHRGGSARLSELIESNDKRHVCHLSVRVEGDVGWVVTAPTTFDAEYFGSLALNQESGAPILQDVESDAPLAADLTAAWDSEHGWHDLEVNSIRLGETTVQARRERMTAAEEEVLF